MNDIPYRLIRVASAYRRALQSVLSEHGQPIREERHWFTTVLYFAGPDYGEEVVVEIEPDLEAGHIRVLAVRFIGDEDGEPVYTKTVDVT